MTLAALNMLSVPNSEWRWRKKTHKVIRHNSEKNEPQQKIESMKSDFDSATRCHSVATYCLFVWRFSIFTRPTFFWMYASLSVCVLCAHFEKSVPFSHLRFFNILNEQRDASCFTQLFQSMLLSIAVKTETFHLFLSVVESMLAWCRSQCRRIHFLLLFFISLSLCVSVCSFNCIHKHIKRNDVVF